MVIGETNPKINERYQTWLKDVASKLEINPEVVVQGEKMLFSDLMNKNIRMRDLTSVFDSLKEKRGKIVVLNKAILKVIATQSLLDLTAQAEVIVNEINTQAKLDTVDGEQSVLLAGPQTHTVIGFYNFMKTLISKIESLGPIQVDPRTDRKIQQFVTSFDSLRTPERDSYNMILFPKQEEIFSWEVSGLYIANDETLKAHDIVLARMFSDIGDEDDWPVDVDRSKIQDTGKMQA